VNGKLRDERLNEGILYSLSEADDVNFLIRRGTKKGLVSIAKGATNLI
jgi:hypothetical protein